MGPVFTVKSLEGQTFEESISFNLELLFSIALLSQMWFRVEIPKVGFWG